MFKGHGHDARVLALLTRANAALQPENGAQPAALDHVELGARPGDQLLHLNLEAMAVYRLAHPTGYERDAIFIQQSKTTALLGPENKGFALIAGGDFQLEYLQLLAPPGVTGKAHEGISHGLLRLRLIATMHERTDNRKQLRLGNDGQLEVVHCLANHLARLEQFDLGHRSGGGGEEFTVTQQAAHAGGLLLDLDHRVGAIYGRAQQGIGDADNGKQQGNGNDDALVVNQGTQQRQKIDFVTIAGWRCARRTLH